jgi:hypothetical protein
MKLDAHEDVHLRCIHVYSEFKDGSLRHKFYMYSSILLDRKELENLP